MKFWAILFFVLPVAGLAYALWRTWHLLPFAPVYKGVVLSLMTLGFLCFIFRFVANIDNLPMWLATTVYEVGTSSIFILLYLVMVYLVMDFGRLIRLIPPVWTEHSARGSLAVLAVMLVCFVGGYIHYNHKYRRPIRVETIKQLPRPLKIVMLSDLHLGYHISRDELSGWVDMINAEHADLILIAGDLIDGHIRPLREQHMEEEFHRLNAPVYACFGNHEYYTGEQESLQFYADAGIHMLRDKAVSVNGINIVGRDDRSRTRRQDLDQLVQGLDAWKYTILLDHQPYKLEEANHCNVDFQFSGHTHYGQVWPISWIENVIYEDAFGPLRKGATAYYVTSGMGIWGGKFRIGTRSEYVVLTVESKKKQR